MRTLCLNLQKNENPSVAENFLVFSPQVYFRDPQLVFLDISKTAHLFGGEKQVLGEALKLSKEFFPQARAAISNTPASAQVFSSEYESYICSPLQEREDLSSLPLKALTQLEGLIAWNRPSEIEDIVHFFQLLGLSRIGEIRSFEIEAFRQRWGETGSLLWKRLHGLDKQLISPLQPTESLTDYTHLDFPISLVSFLLHCMEKALKRLFLRLEGRGEFARKLSLHLHCEYSDQYHLIELSPNTPNRNLDLYMKLLENKVAQLDLENPIKEFEIEITPCPENIRQLDFWEPRTSDREKLHQMISVFQQASITTGFLKPKNEIMPEESWEISPDFEDFDHIEDQVSVEGQSFEIRNAYSQALSQAPRPSRILRQARRLTSQQIKRLQFLSQRPIERLEEGWWEKSRGRDYYFALDRKGEMLWVYYDQIEDQFFLHGYFD